MALGESGFMTVVFQCPNYWWDNLNKLSLVVLCWLGTWQVPVPCREWWNGGQNGILTEPLCGQWQKWDNDIIMLLQGCTCVALNLKEVLFFVDKKQIPIKLFVHHLWLRLKDRESGKN